MCPTLHEGSPEAVFKEKQGVWDPMLEPTISYNPTLSHSGLRSPAFHPKYKGKGIVWGRSLLLVGYLSANFHKRFLLCQ